MENIYQGQITEHSPVRRQKSGKYAREEGPGPQKNKRRWLLPVVIMAVALVILVAVLLFGDRADVLQGQWRIDEITAYRFDGKGSGALILPEQSFAFSYTVEEDRLCIDFVSESARDFSYTFIIAGECLTLSGGEGDEMVSYMLVREPEE